MTPARSSHVVLSTPTRGTLRLTQERLARGWSKAELARRARLDQGNMSRIEARRAIPYPRQLARLARALGVPADVLLTDVETTV